LLAQGDQLAPREHAVRIDIGRDGTEFAARFEDRDAGGHMREIGARLRQALFIELDRRQDLVALGAQRRDGANLGHAGRYGPGSDSLLVAIAP